MKNTKKTYIKNCTINLFTPNDMVEYHHNNDYAELSEHEIKSMYDMNEFYMGNHLRELDGEWKSFNTYNNGAPIVIDGAYCGEFEAAVVNIQLGGDVRGNYSKPYLVEGYDNVVSLLTQDTELYIELSDGREFRLMCDNGEGYFDLEDIDPYWINFDEPLTEDQLETIETEMEEL